ncbi:HNH endonuclease, partial [Plantibacter flavus]|uniref:HNH endonuclease signature motif containing protein n=1 Tax=Plantibacter flavus TaxID=150123 RepID=UPI003F17F3D0
APLAYAIRERLDAAAIPTRVAGDARTLAQLRADALASLAIAGTVTTDGSPIPTDPDAPTNITWLPGSATPPELRPSTDILVEEPIDIQAHIRASVHLTVPALSVLGITEEPGTLDGYGPIDPDTAARLTITAPSMTRILTHPETGTVLSVGRDQYHVPTDLQRAVRVRDTTCRAPGCARPARSCDLDHTTAWQHHGTTSLDNLASLCRHHHRLKHHPGWQIEQHPGSTLHWTTPDGRHHTTTPEHAETG